MLYVSLTPNLDRNVMEWKKKEKYLTIIWIQVVHICFSNEMDILLLIIVEAPEKQPSSQAMCVSWENSPCSYQTGPLNTRCWMNQARYNRACVYYWKVVMYFSVSLVAAQLPGINSCWNSLWCWQLPGDSLGEALIHHTSAENFYKKVRWRDVTENSDQWNPFIARCQPD